MNCQGLGDMKKRRDIFHYLRNKNYSIYLLQDTHFDSKLETYVKSEWGYTCFFASYKTNSRGVAVLFNNNFEFKIKEVYKDLGGNYLLVHVNMLNTDIIITCVYGPNKDEPQFYISLEKKLKEFTCDNIIICGDWNLVMNFSLDYCNYKRNNNVKAQEQVETMMFNLDLVDIWRELNPELRRYTWRRSKPFQQSRLDFFAISENLSNLVVDADILPGYRTDHSLVILSLVTGQEETRSTLWKFNSSLLKDKNYLNKVNVLIQDVITEYAALPYSRSNLMEVPVFELQLVISDQLFLDTLLMKVRAETIIYASKRKRENQQKEKELETNIINLERLGKLTEMQLIDLSKYKEELVTIREKRMEGVLLRSRAKWIAEGEKVTKYFCALEKRNYVSKQILKLIKSDGNETTNSIEITQEVYCFFSNLYLEKPVESFNLNNIFEAIPTLTFDEQNLLEGEITLKEASFVLKNMANNKSPGSDGFTAEFFKVFWKVLGGFVVRSLNEGFKKGELSTTQKEGIIVCIPKGDKPRNLIKNFRPISLLNIVYKIGSACIANRLKAVLPLLISEDQTGFMKNRYLGDNVRFIFDLIDYLNTNKQPGLLLCLDFEKAFDSVSWKFMFNVLGMYGFGKDFCNWVHSFYNNIKSTVSVNGKLTPWFLVQRGCRQGDPLSPYLFLLCVEILSILIKQNDKIKGIKVSETESKILQYADDTELTLEGDRESFEEAIETVNLFGKMSGLVLNSDKSCAIWLGSKRNSPQKYMPHLKMIWNPDNFKILGICFTNDLKDCIKLNFDEKFLEVKALYKIWLKRQLTPLGRVAVLKSLILSKLVHLWLLLPNPPDSIIVAMQKTVFQFVWNLKNDRISRKVSVKNVNQGGLGIPDIRRYMDALKLTWIRKLFTSNMKWKCFLNCNEKLALSLDKTGSAVGLFMNVNDFWTDVFNAYFDFGKNICVETVDEVVSEPLFCNDKILINKKPFCCRKWIKEGVYLIAHLLDENGNFMLYQAFRDKYNIHTDFLKYNGCVQAIKEYLRKVGIHIISNETDARFEKCKALRIVCSVHKGARLYYDTLMHDDFVPNCCEKWDVRIHRNVEWKFIFQNIAKIKDINLKWLQIRIVHRILGTNITCHNMGIVDNTLCTFCKKHKENIQHIMWNCECVQNFWCHFQNMITKNCQHVCNHLILNEHLVIFGCDNSFKSDLPFDLILLLAKSYIYKCKMKNELPALDNFVKILKYRYEMEKYNASLRMKLEIFLNQWNMYKNLLIS